MIVFIFVCFFNAQKKQIFLGLFLVIDSNFTFIARDFTPIAFLSYQKDAKVISEEIRKSRPELFCKSPFFENFAKFRDQQL